LNLEQTFTTSRDDSSYQTKDSDPRSKKKNQLISFPRTDTEANRRSCAWQMQGCCSPGDGSEHKVIVGERELWAVAMRGLEGEKVT
jgi:hypothetical protein